MIVTGPGVLTTAEDCVTVDRQLREAIRLAYGVRRRMPPLALLDLATEIHECSERYRASLQARGTPGTGDRQVGEAARDCDQPVWLTAEEAANCARVSPSYVRRMLRKGSLTGDKAGHQGRWMVDQAELQAWVTRRTATTRKAA